MGWTEADYQRYLSRIGSNVIAQPHVPCRPIHLTLPYPPTINTYWNPVGSQLRLSEHGKHYRDEVGKAILVTWPHDISRPLSSLLAVHIIVHPYDHRPRDLDNICKASIDGLTHAGVWVDDSLIDDLHIVRGKVVSPGHLEVTITSKGL